MNLSHLFFPLTEVILDFISPSSGHFVELLFQASVELLSQPPGWVDNERRVREGHRVSRRPSGSPANLAQWNVSNLILKRSVISLLIFFFPFFYSLDEWGPAFLEVTSWMQSSHPTPLIAAQSSQPVEEEWMEAWPKGWVGSPTRSWPYEHPSYFPTIFQLCSFLRWTELREPEYQSRFAHGLEWLWG